MRIAFVGKGGSGKSTITGLFFLHLVEQHLPVLCLDADLNIHIPKLLGVNIPSGQSLSTPKNVLAIRTYLKGNSSYIRSIDHFYKTTPPSTGVNLITVNSDNPIIKKFFYSYTNSSYVGIVGTYQDDEIGKSCYHTNLSICENILSFTKLNHNEWIVADMVAGIDAFSNTLHAQFDTLILVVEPTQESIHVFRQYQELAHSADIHNNLFVIGNKVEDSDDETFLKKNIPESIYLGFFPKYQILKKQRQENKPLSHDVLHYLNRDLLFKTQHVTEAHLKDPNERLKKLHALHLSYIAQDYVRNAVGDISDQIDLTFRL
ncbi:MAG: ATP-binding protein [Patescibacteria group bacterium]|nr:ATP-binding protein [Patescibacteria group bacterium]